MMTTSQDEFLKKYYISEGSDIVSYNALSEDQKAVFSKDIVAAIIKSIEDRKYELDNSMIDRSKGDIEKVENYEYIKTSLDLLHNLQAGMDTTKIPYLDTCSNAHANLLKFKPEFEKGYKLGKDIVTILYSSLVLSLIQSISFLIATSIDYIKDPMGNYEANVRYNLKKNNNYPTVNIECLDKFNLMSNNGDMQNFFTTIYTAKKLQESAIGDFTDTFSSVLGFTYNVVSDFARVLIFIGQLIPSIPELLRMIVSSYYHSRIKLSNYLRLQAQYIQLNTERLRNLESPKKDSIKKQEKIMNDLLQLADKIDIDQKTASKNAKTEIEIQNKNISKSIKKNSPATRPESGAIEEIIL